MPSLRHRVLARVIPVVRHRSEVTDPEQVRRDVLARQAAADDSAPARVARRHDVGLSERCGLPVHELCPSSVRPGRTVLYLHGGGFVAGLDANHWRYAARLADGVGVRVLLPAYPLAPAYTWKDALPRLVDLYDEVAAESPDGVVVMGDSAGGGLAVALVQRLVQRPGPRPTHLVAFAPWVDLAGSTPGTDEAAADDPWLTLSKLRLYGTWWGAGDPPVREASPLFGDLSGFPPTLLFCGTRDVLVPQVRELARGLSEAGSPVTYVEEPGLLHVFPILPLPEAKPAWHQVRAFL